MAISELKAKIGSVCYNKGALPDILGKRFNTYFVKLERIIYRKTQELGESIRNEARLEMMASEGSGNWYKYVEYDPESKTEEELYKWQASSPYDLPAAVSTKLANAIEYFIMSDKGDILSELTIGVFSSGLGGRPGGMYKTVAFVGPKKLTKKEIEEGEVPDEAGRLIVIEGRGKQTKLYKIAQYLEEGTDKMAKRPFLTKLFEKYLDKFKEDIRMEARELLNETFGKKIPVYFRIYTRKNT